MLINVPIQLFKKYEMISFDRKRNLIYFLLYGVIFGKKTNLLFLNEAIIEMIILHAYNYRYI